MTSAYPIAVDELTDRVREHALTVGAWPSRNQIKNKFRVGGPKAKAALDALRASGFNPAGGELAGELAAVAVRVPTAGLHIVTDPAGPDSGRGDQRGNEITTPVHPTAGREDRQQEQQPATPASVGSAPPDVATTAEAGPEVSAPVSAPVSDAVGPDTAVRARFGSWPLVLIALGAFVSIWGGWVGLGELTGFGPIRLLPGIADQVVINSAITLPIGVEAYAAFALRTWLAPPGAVSQTARRFARWSAIGALALGAAGQIAYHLMVAAGITHAPWQITAFVSCLPVVVLGCGAALTHLIHQSHQPGEGTR